MEYLSVVSGDDSSLGFELEAEVRILVWGSIGSVITAHLFDVFRNFKINGGLFGLENICHAILVYITQNIGIKWWCITLSHVNNGGISTTYCT